ncbi:hypothetical protein PCH_Pc18g03530 [Penicillium rubens Wisconsin 54-1255]|uniref:Uncharacterized protein n=1 Tax=Penicillium rubens (strain ATCC 28089 / DSM 1075 / NRRL 1951 / Wisconsin 54-1255) TaxID=500485 RepID=B6HBB9_PENRW|nr:hypothetical protein PCH_Pc18g03530 [Penicillium rubens Wisconsin 54-1255]
MYWNCTYTGRKSQLVRRTDRTESKKSFDRTSLDLICPICLICGLQADLYPQVESGGGSRTIPHSVELEMGKKPSKFKLIAPHEPPTRCTADPQQILPETNPASHVLPATFALAL